MRIRKNYIFYNPRKAFFGSLVRILVIVAIIAAVIAGIILLVKFHRLTLVVVFGIIAAISLVVSIVLQYDDKSLSGKFLSAFIIAAGVCLALALLPA